MSKWVMGTAVVSGALIATGAGANIDFWSPLGEGGQLGGPPFGSATSVRSEIFVDTDGIIKSFDGVDIFGLTHEWQGDLVITLTHKDTLTSVVLYDGSILDDSDDILLGDYEINDSGDPWPHGITIVPGKYAPDGPGLLSDFIGEEIGGTWSLFMTDALPTSGGGAFEGWDFHAQLVPAPGALALLGLAGLVTVRRRRR